jgi:hypothetical protein
VGVSERTVQCYSDCSYPGMTTQPGEWNLREYCEFYDSTSCMKATVSSCSCLPSCLSDCVDVFCDTMSSLSLLCAPSSSPLQDETGAAYLNKSSIQASCLDAYAATSPTQTLMTFLAALVFNNVNSIEMSTGESQEVAIVSMEMSISGVTASEIKIEKVVDGVSDITTTTSSLHALRSTPLSPQTLSASNVTYKFSVILEALGYDATSSSTAYLQLTEAITSAVVDGRLEENLRVVGVKVAVTTFSSVTIPSPPRYSNPVVTSLSLPPSLSPSSEHRTDSGDDDDQSPQPLHLALYILGGVLGMSFLALGGLMTLKRQKRIVRENQSKEIETRTTLTENPLQEE